MNNIDETELERRRSAAHRVEVIEEAVGGALLMAAAAALMWLYCKATPAQLSGESDWSAGVEARTEPRHALPMVTLSENGESAAGAVRKQKPRNGEVKVDHDHVDCESVARGATRSNTGDTPAAARGDIAAGQ